MYEKRAAFVCRSWYTEGGDNVVDSTPARQIHDGLREDARFINAA